MLERKLFAFKFNDEWECMYTVADVTRTEEKSGHIDVVLIGVQQQWNATAELMKLPPQPYQNWKLSGWRRLRRGMQWCRDCNFSRLA